MFRAGVETILGLTRRGPVFSIQPCIPRVWPRFSLSWRFGRTTYAIEVENPERRTRGVAGAALDGEAVDPAAIPLSDDGAVHRVNVVLGAPAAPPSG
jgi:cyclic beta-1,2-glucan synthetase